MSIKCQFSAELQHQMRESLDAALIRKRKEKQGEDYKII